MNRLSWSQRLYWNHFGRPATDKALFRHLVSHEIASVLEVGMGNCQRVRRIAKLIQAPSGVDAVRYIGTDEFEAASTEHGHLSLKQAHQIAGSLGFKASLIPGDISAALPRVAHKMGASDLIIVDGGMDPQNPMASELGNWLNRIAHSESTIFACAEVGQDLVPVASNLCELTVPKAA